MKDVIMFGLKINLMINDDGWSSMVYFHSVFVCFCGGALELSESDKVRMEDVTGVYEEDKEPMLYFIKPFGTHSKDIVHLNMVCFPLTWQILCLIYKQAKSIYNIIMSLLGPTQAISEARVDFSPLLSV